MTVDGHASDAVMHAVHYGAAKKYVAAQTAQLAVERRPIMMKDDTV